ncbi:MAG: ComEC/Rec2 family competence protein [Anaerolineae bacterium]|nr:ComEC/Rec2 family competence protein [Anaerolineae bacterium]
MLLFYMVMAWCSGIALSAARPEAVIEHSALPALVALSGVAGAVLSYNRRNVRRLCLCLAAAGFGMIHHGAALEPFRPDQLAFYNDLGTAVLEGTISAPPERRENALRFRLSARQWQRGEAQQDVHGDALIYAQRYADVRYGDLVRVRGTPQTPPTFDAFSFRDFLARQGVHTIVLDAEVSVLARDQGDPFLTTLYKVRTEAKALIRRLLPDPQAAFLVGILLGDESDITAELADAFQRTNTSHLLAISGANVAVIVALLMALARLLPRRLAGRLGTLTVTICGVALYTLFVGAEPSVVRAAIMATFALLAERLGRRNDGLTALAAAIFIMTALNPLMLFDLGLIMSAAATLGLILYVPALTQLSQHFLKRLSSAAQTRRVVSAIAELVLIAVAAQITTLPIILLLSGAFAPLSVLVNLLVAPAQPLIMSGGLVALGLGALWQPLGQVAAWLVGLPLSYTLALIRGAAELPSLSLPVTLTPLSAALYYGALFGMTAFAMQHPTVRRRLWTQLRRAGRSTAVVLIGVGVAALLWLFIAARPDGKLHLWWLDVGEGSAVLLQTPHGAHILIDGGKNPQRLQQALGDRLPFYKRHLDVLIVSAPHDKLIGALPALLERYSVGALLHNGQRTGSATFAAFEQARRARGIPEQVISAGWRLETSDGVRIVALSPHAVPEVATRPDTAPLILRVEYGEARFLLAAEASPEAIGDLLSRSDDLHAHVLQLPANGAADRSPPRLLERTQPQLAVVVAERGDLNAQPAQALLERLTVPLYRTDQGGALHLVTDGTTLSIRTTR